MLHRIHIKDGARCAQRRSRWLVRKRLQAVVVRLQSVVASLLVPCLLAHKLPRLRLRLRLQVPCLPPLQRLSTGLLRLLPGQML
jgi:hypothetical protein